MGHEEKALLNQVSSYIQSYGGSRFPTINAQPEDLAKVATRAGFTRTESGEVQYLIESGAFKNELCKGTDIKFATKILIEHGWLIHGGDQRPTQKPRIPALGKAVRVYVINSKSIEGELHG